MKHALSLLVLGLLVIVACNGNPFDAYGNLWGRPDAGTGVTCAIPQQWFYCDQIVKRTNPPAGQPAGSCAIASVVVCSGSIAQAGYQAQSKFNALAPGYTWVRNDCFSTGWTTVTPAETNPKPLLYTGPPGQGNPRPFDYTGPLCDLGPDAGPATCIPGSDPCRDCLNTCCTEWTACTAGGDPGNCCADLVGYWTGQGPACAASEGTPGTDALSACWTANGCGDVCGQYLHLPDGGL
jgi:hypothetical protein